MRRTWMLGVMGIVAACALEAAGAQREELDGFLEAGAKAWAAGDLPAARAEFARAVAAPEALAHYRSYAHLRLAESFAAGKDPARAREEYAKIAAEAAYPPVHRQEARERAAELEQEAKGLPARDPATSRTKVDLIERFATEFYIAPSGDDANPGTRERPFATLERARDAARAAKGAKPGAIAVRLLPGQYPRRTTFELSAADSGSADAPVVYRADKPGTAALYGGMRITGFAQVNDPAILARLPEEARGKVYQADLGKQGVTDLAPLVERGYGRPAPRSTLEVFFNGEPMTLARWPNQGFVDWGAIVEPGSTQTKTPSVFTYVDDRHARWTKAEDAWVYGYFQHGWADRALKVIRIDPEKKQLACAPYDRGMTPVKWFNNGKGKYFAFNLLEEMDRPGEWYLDRVKGVLYLYPPSDPAAATIEIGMLSVPMVTVTGAAHVRFEGLVFDLSRANCMVMRNSSQCLVAGCTVRRFASDGIAIEGGTGNGIFGCDISSLGRRATEVSGGDRRTLTPGGHFVENCRMYQFGRLDHTYVPAVQLEGVGNRVAHNLFHDCPSSVVRIEGNDHVLEYNRVHRAVLESEDQGAMELWGNPTYRGVVFRYNRFSDIGLGADMNGSAGRAAIRFDDTISGMLVYGNIFHRAAQSFGAVQINSGRDNVFDNNVFAECEKGITGGYNAGNDHWKRLGVSRDFFESELYLERYPEMKRMREQPGLSFVWRNVFWKCGPALPGRRPADKFDAMGNAEYAGEDPGFVDAAKGDWRLRPDAAALARIGLRPIPVELIGPYAHPLRASWPARLDQ